MTHPTCTIHLTEAASERILDLRDNAHQAALIRLYVQGGGCAGFEYRIEMAKERHEDDICIKQSPYITLLIDSMSAPYLDGTTIDYEQDDLDSRFTFHNPQATSTCGCGSSFSIN